MRRLRKIPQHNHLSELYYVGIPDQAASFQRQLINEQIVIQCEKETKLNSDSELAEICATNYYDEKFERAFMVPKQRCPTWTEMVALKELIWYRHEATFQVHPKKKDYVNIVPTALHLWRPKTLIGKIRMRQACFLVRHTLRKLSVQSDGTDDIKFLKDVIYGKSFVAIYCGKDWATWEEVCKIKEDCFGPDRTAVQFNINRKIDLNTKKILTLWDADELGIPLPPKECV